MGSRKRKTKKFRQKKSNRRSSSINNYEKIETRTLTDSIHSTIEFGSNTVTKYVLNPFSSAVGYMYNCALNGSQKVCFYELQLDDNIKFF